MKTTLHWARYLVIGLVLTAATAGMFLFADDKPSDITTLEDLETWIDPATGCVYYHYARTRGYSGYSGMTIRMRADGLPDCPQVVVPSSIPSIPNNQLVEPYSDW